jgi:hypothetical protein
VTWWARPLKAQLATLPDRELRTFLKTIRTRPIVIKRLDGPKRRIRTREIGIRIIRVAHEVADLKVLAVPHRCHTRRRAVSHGHSCPSPQL